MAACTPWTRLAILFNPSMPYRVAHMLLASGLTVSFLISGLSAWRLLRGDTRPDAAATLRTGVTLAAVLIPLQVFVGDAHGLNTLEHQPAKIAAMEGVWHTERGAPLLLFAVPDEKQQVNHLELAIPHGASLILRHDSQGEIRGVADFPAGHPPVLPLFYAFRVMVGMALLMLAVSWFGAWRMRRGALPPRLWLRRDGGDDFCRMDRDACRLVRHRDRSAAVAGLRCAAHCGCRYGQADPHRHQPLLVPDDVCRADRGLHQRAVLHGAQGWRAAVAAFSGR